MSMIGVRSIDTPGCDCNGDWLGLMNMVGKLRLLI